METELKMFNKYPSTGIVVKDPSITHYISLQPVLFPRSYGRAAGKKFGKSKVHIVERLIEKLQVPGHKGKKHWKTSKFCTGKSATTTRLVEDACDIIAEKTKKNPIEVLVKAVENAAPRQEVTVIEIGGLKIPKQVETSPQRRIDLALRWIVQGTYQGIHQKKVKMAQALADELISASMGESKSFAVSKMSEVERQAAASK